MSLREFELYMEGQDEKWSRVRQMMAWVLANLMNAHVGKRKFRPRDLLSKADQARVDRNMKRGKLADVEKPDLTSASSPAEARRLKQEYVVNKTHATYWLTPEGRRVAAVMRMVGYGEGLPTSKKED